MSIIRTIRHTGLYQSLRQAAWKLIYSILQLQYLFKKRKSLLVYLGMNRGKNFDKIFWQYERCIAVEADPELFEWLKHKYRHHKKVELVHGAATDFNGTVSFNISNHGGVSSSIGKIKDVSESHIQIVKTITVPAFNLCEYLQKNKIDFIEDYISDIQGNDLNVLKTMKPYIEAKKIRYITSEVAKNEFSNMYEGLPDNSENGFNELLSAGYTMVSKGWGVLKENKFTPVPGSWMEMDCMWKLKS